MDDRDIRAFLAAQDEIGALKNRGRAEFAACGQALVETWAGHNWRKAVTAIKAEPELRESKVDPDQAFALTMLPGGDENSKREGSVAEDIAQIETLKTAQEYRAADPSAPGLNNFVHYEPNANIHKPFFRRIANYILGLMVWNEKIGYDPRGWAMVTFMENIAYYKNKSFRWGGTVAGHCFRAGTMALMLPIEERILTAKLAVIEGMEYAERKDAGLWRLDRQFKNNTKAARMASDLLTLETMMTIGDTMSSEPAKKNLMQQSISGLIKAPLVKAIADAVAQRGR
jgi:hypothetical protein